MLQAYLSSSPTTSTSGPVCNHAHSRQEDSSNSHTSLSLEKAATVQLALVDSRCYDRRNGKKRLVCPSRLQVFRSFVAMAARSRNSSVLANQEAERARLGPKTDIACKAHHERDHIPKVSQPPGTASPLRTEQACGDHVIVKPEQDSTWSSHTAKCIQGNFKSPQFQEFQR